MPSSPLELFMSFKCLRNDRSGRSTMARVDWSSLPPDLINLVADCFVDTNDLDYYMDLRAVCRTWRNTTIDPKTSQDPRFRPSAWIMLDETSPSDTRLFLNLTTGRFLHRNVLQLRHFDLVTSTIGGFLVLADRNKPHTVSLLNPFTGAMISFLAPLPVPPGSSCAAAVVGSAPILVLASASSGTVYWADPHEDSFGVDRSYDYAAARRLPLIAGNYGPVSEELDNRITDAKIEGGLLLYLISDSAGETMLAIFKRPDYQGMNVFRLNVKSGKLGEEVTDIGNRAVILGYRCFIVDADRIPSIEANCIYHEQDQSGGVFPNILKYDLSKGKEETVSQGISGLLWNFDFLFGPFSVIQLLCRYALKVPRSRLYEEDP